MDPACWYRRVRPRLFWRMGLLLPLELFLRWQATCRYFSGNATFNLISQSKQISSFIQAVHIFKEISIYIFIWLRRFFVACGTFHGRLFTCGIGSIVAARRLSCSLAYGIMVSPPGTESMSPCIAMQILNHWTTREIPQALRICHVPATSRLWAGWAHTSFLHGTHTLAAERALQRDLQMPWVWKEVQEIMDL